MLIDMLAIYVMWVEWHNYLALEVCQHQVFKRLDVGQAHSAVRGSNPC
jgi:hypothetical protein